MRHQPGEGGIEIGPPLGNGPLEEELKTECSRRGLNRRVRFVGAREDIIDLYSAADAFVMSSEFEGLSAALLEASAMGLPAVVTKVGGNPEITVDGITGYLVPPGNSDQLADSMNTLMNASPDQRRILSRNARQLCCENYGFESIAERWIDLYTRYLPATCAGQVSGAAVMS